MIAALFNPHVEGEYSLLFFVLYILLSMGSLTPFPSLL